MALKDKDLFRKNSRENINYLLRKGYIPLQILYKQVKSAILLNVHKNVCFLLQRLQLL